MQKGRAALYIVSVLIIGTCGILLYDTSLQQHGIEVTVVDRWDGPGGYEAFSDKNNNTYLIKDSRWWLGITDSLSRTNIVQVGRTYRMDTLGGRLDWWIFRPNPYDITEI